MTDSSEKSLDNFPEFFFTSELPDKYGIKKSAVYERLGALCIKPHKQGNRSYIDSDQLHLMDDLHAHLAAGGKIDSFVQACLESGRIVPPTDLATQSEAEAIVLSQQKNEAVFVSQQREATLEEISFVVPPTEAMSELQEQRELRVSESDVQEANVRGQYRAATKIITEDILTQVYEVTEQFTVPGLKEQVERNREALKKSRSNQRMVNRANDFLAQTMKASGVSGFKASTTSNSEVSPTSESANGRASA